MLDEKAQRCDELRRLVDEGQHIGRGKQTVQHLKGTEKVSNHLSKLAYYHDDWLVEIADGPAVHLESLINEIQVVENEVVAIIRMGTDLTSNFYQIEFL